MAGGRALRHPLARQAGKELAAVVKADYVVVSNVRVEAASIEDFQKYLRDRYIDGHDAHAVGSIDATSEASNHGTHHINSSEGPETDDSRQHTSGEENPKRSRPLNWAMYHYESHLNKPPQLIFWGIYGYV
ncbi:hypothetical protein MMC11_005256 [Xylographa trunciseda]|nr:hypothetical protein [Xylographa trunciseda]